MIYVGQIRGKSHYYMNTSTCDAKVLKLELQRKKLYLIYLLKLYYLLYITKRILNKWNIF